jgi:hypothetical protein
MESEDSTSGRSKGQNRLEKVEFLVKGRSASWSLYARIPQADTKRPLALTYELNDI